MGKRKKNSKLKKEKARKFYQETLAKKAKDKEQATRSKYKIPAHVTLPKIEEERLKEISENSYRLVFSNYNHQVCDLCNIGRKAKPLIKLLDRMAKSSPKNKSSLIRSTIKRSEAEGDYRNLFSSLSEDIEILYESSFGESERVFFFTLDRPAKNFLNVVSIKPRHLSTDR